MPLPTPKPPTADGNPPEYNAMKDLAERCAKAGTELERVKIERDEALVARDFADAALERVQKQAAAMREALSYELRLADKQIELLKLRSSEDASAADTIRPFGSNLWKMKKRLEAALQPDAGSGKPDASVEAPPYEYLGETRPINRQTGGKLI